MQSQDKPYQVFLYWTLANLAGLLVVAGISFIFPFLGYNPGKWASIIILGVPPSLAQWVLVRRYQPSSSLWILSIPIALLLFVSVIQAVPDPTSDYFDDESALIITLMYMIFGLFLGVFQWFILRRRYTRAWIWIVGTFLSVGIGAGLFMAIGPGFASAIIFSGIYILGTGICLLQITNHPLLIGENARAT